MSLFRDIYCVFYLFISWLIVVYFVDMDSTCFNEAMYVCDVAIFHAGGHKDPITSHRMQGILCYFYINRQQFSHTIHFL